MNWAGVVSSAGEAATSEVVEEHRQDLVAGQLRQNDVLAWAGFLSPYLAARDLSMGVTGSGPDATEAFLAQAEEHRYAIIQRLNDLHASEIHYENDRAQRVSRDHWQQFPVFETPVPPLAGALAARSIPLTALALWVVLPGTGLAMLRRRLARVEAEGSS